MARYAKNWGDGLRKFHTEQMFVSVRMQMRKPCKHTISEGLQGLRYIYMILNLECCECARMRFYCANGLACYCAVANLRVNNGHGPLSPSDYAYVLNINLSSFHPAGQPSVAWGRRVGDRTGEAYRAVRWSVSGPGAVRDQEVRGGPRSGSAGAGRERRPESDRDRFEALRKSPGKHCCFQIHQVNTAVFKFTR